MPHALTTCPHNRGKTTFLKRQSREGFADIERRAVAIVSPMIGRGELLRLRHLSCEQSAGERQAHDDADTLLLRFGEDGARGFLPEQVENNLQRTKSFLRETDFGFVHGFDARAEIDYFSFALQRA